MKYRKLEETDYIINKGDVLASKAYHLMFPEGRDSVCNTGIKKIDGKSWEIFWIKEETQDAYYGSPAEGLGLMNCMILKSDTREFLPEEIEKLNKQKYSLGGMFSGKVTMVQPVVIEPIVSRWENKNEYI